MGFSLFLHPGDVGATVDRPRLIKELEAAGFLQTEPLSAAIRPGPRLMEYITYLGCSPALSSGGVEAAVRLHHYDRPVWIGGEAIDRLRFPGCGHAIASGAALIEQGDSWQCPECGNHGDLASVGWRRSAARARLFIEISPIFPREAVPSDALLERLRQASGSAWQWFYSRGLP